MAENPLAQVLRDAWYSDRPHRHRLILTAAVIATALNKAGMRATLVGGGAVELYAPGAYQTLDIDFIVEGRPRAEFARVFESLGLKAKDRGWLMDDLFVEVPALWMEDPVDVVNVGPYELRVIKKEWILGERIAGFRHWKYWGSGIQAISMIRSFGAELDEVELRQSLKREGTAHAYELLRELADSDQEVSTGQLDALWHAHYR
jgi:hypothetical protein